MGVMGVVFLSNQLFDYPLKTNKWHVATRMAERGHNALFVDPPIRFRKFVKQVFQGRWPLRRILTFAYQPQKNLTVYTPVGLTPFKSFNSLSSSNSSNSFKSFNPFNNGESACTICCPFGQRIVQFLRSLNQRFHLRRIKNLLILYPKPYTLNPILWTYHVEMENLEDYIASIPHDLLIYDCVDNYPAFPRYRDTPEQKNWIVEREEWLAKKADLVFTTAPCLQERLSKLNKNTFYVGNAGDYVRFAEIPNPKPQTLNPVIGFSGALDAYKVNLPLLVKVAKTYPKYSLALIGPTGVADDEPNLKELKSLPNVEFLGSKPYEEMPQYFSQFDVYIIPYNLNEYTLGGCFPVKFFDALAAGRPTVVTDLPCYEDFVEVCYIAKDDEDFIKSIKTAVEENSPEKISARQKIAKENSWDKKVERMLKIIRSFK